MDLFSLFAGLLIGAALSGFIYLLIYLLVYLPEDSMTFPDDRLFEDEEPEGPYSSAEAPEYLRKADTVTLNEVLSSLTLNSAVQRTIGELLDKQEIISDEELADRVLETVKRYAAFFMSVLKLEESNAPQSPTEPSEDSVLDDLLETVDDLIGFVEVLAEAFDQVGIHIVRFSV